MTSGKKYQINLRLWLAAWIFLASSSIIVNFDFVKSKTIQIPVQETDFAAQFFFRDSVRPVIKRYQNAVIISSPKIELPNTSLFIRMLNPTKELFSDTIYCFLIMITAIMCLYKLWNFNYTNPFKQNFGKTIKWVAIIFLFFWIINLLRLWWFDKQIRNLTGNQYYYGIKLFERFEFWIGILLFRLSQMIRKGESLQQEQDLTV